MRIPVLDQPCHAFMGNTAPNLMDLDPIFVRDCALIVTRVHASDSLDQTKHWVFILTALSKVYAIILQYKPIVLGCTHRLCLSNVQQQDLMTVILQAQLF